jgi:hypothetical protein
MRRDRRLEQDVQYQDGAAFGGEAVRRAGEGEPEVAEHEDDTMGSVVVSQTTEGRAQGAGEH